MKNQKLIFWTLLCVCVLTGCQSFTGFDFDSDAIVGGGAVAGKDYITGLKPSLKAREYFVKSNVNASQKKTVTPGDDQGTGVVWTDDGGIVIPPGCSIEFENKGYCLDPHLPAPGAGHEMQFVRIASLLPDELQGTYRNLLKRSTAGDEDVKNNMQRLVWALRTAGSQDAMATHLTDRQREILSECAEDGSFEDFVYRQEMYGKIVEELKSKFVNRIKDSTSVRVGNVVYDAFDLLDPDKGKQKVEAHLQSLISMGLNLPVTQTGFNYGELENGIFTDIKGNGPLSFKAKIANSTSQPYTFYPMNYAAQVGSGGSSVGFYAAANSGMCQRGTCSVPESGEVGQNDPIYESVYKILIAKYINAVLAKFPKIGNAVPYVTSDMIVFDPKFDYEMAYDKDNNKFIFQDEDVWNKLDENNWWGYDSLQCYNIAHEAAHYFHEKALSSTGEYVELNNSNVELAEGFAVLMGMRISGINAVRDTCNARAYGLHVLSFLNNVARQGQSSKWNLVWKEIDNGVKNEIDPTRLSWIQRCIFPWENGEKTFEKINSLPTSEIVKGLKL